ncbi:MAG: DUF1634 domain-containing protein [Thermoplasmata archaeon]|nr:DUF1634 domain-containing protein [Thermoplasmata archaeon]
MTELEPLPAGEDPAFEAVMAKVLRGGLYTSIVLIIVGLAISAVGGLPSIDFGGVPSVHAGSPLGSWGALVVFLGLLLLVLTPVFRVGCATFLFARAKDRAFTAITLFVLVVLVATFVVGALR